MPKNQKGFSIILIIVFISLLIIGGYLFFRLVASRGNSNSESIPEETADSNCTTGINGNSGDNFCSNYHEISSKCRPGMSNNYADNCTKGNH